MGPGMFDDVPKMLALFAVLILIAGAIIGFAVAHL